MKKLNNGLWHHKTSYEAKFLIFAIGLFVVLLGILFL